MVTIRRILGLITILLSLGLILWGVIPLPRAQSGLGFTPEMMTLPEMDAPAPPAVLETRTLRLEAPAAIRAGDSDLVQLTLDSGAETISSTPGASVAVTQTVSFPNVYNTHSVLAEARLDLAGAQVSPAGLVSQSLLPGRAVTFYWSVRPAEASTYRGVVWLYLRFIPLGGGVDTQLALSAQPLEIQGADLFGLTGEAARLLGVLGVILGSLISLDAVVEWLRKVNVKR